MTTEELIAMLSKVPPDTPVVHSKDVEGNGFSPIVEADIEAKYVSETKWSGDVIHPDDYPAYDPDELVSVVCLWPIN